MGGAGSPTAKPGRQRLGRLAVRVWDELCLASNRVAGLRQTHGGKQFCRCLDSRALDGGIQLSADPHCQVCSAISAQEEPLSQDIIPPTTPLVLSCVTHIS